jgi:hypothetical protein
MAAPAGRFWPISQGDPYAGGTAAEHGRPVTAIRGFPGASGTSMRWGGRVACPGQRETGLRRVSCDRIVLRGQSRGLRMPMLLLVMSVLRRSTGVMGGMVPPIDATGMPCQ